MCVWLPVLADISFAFGYSFGGAHQLIGQGTPNLQGETLDRIEKLQLNIFFEHKRHHRSLGAS